MAGNQMADKCVLTILPLMGSSLTHLHLTQAAKAAGDQAQAANGDHIPPYPGLDRRIPSSVKLADMVSSQQNLLSSHSQYGKLLGSHRAWFTVV